jgi:hypothetical protein
MRGSLRLLVFAGGLLAGMQVPSYLDQYEKRVDAHLLEVTYNLSGFQETANQMFDGDMEALIAYYEDSDDRVFVQDANSIRSIYNRYLLLTREQFAASAPWYGSAFHMLFSADPELRAEALSGYTVSVPLDLGALEWGFGVAILVTLIVELLFSICWRLLVGKRGRRRQGLT